MEVSWSETGQCDNDDHSVLKVKTIYDNEEKKLKNLLNIGLGKENQVTLKIQVNSASPVSFFNELKLRDPYLKIYPVHKPKKDIYYGIIGKLVTSIFSNG